MYVWCGMGAKLNLETSWRVRKGIGLRSKGNMNNMTSSFGWLMQVDSILTENCFSVLLLSFVKVIIRATLYFVISLSCQKFNRHWLSSCQTANRSQMSVFWLRVCQPRPFAFITTINHGPLLNSSIFVRPRRMLTEVVKYGI